MADKKKQGPRERLTSRAFELFYKQGYSTTGINQLMDESGTHRKSFYRYFPSKDDLGLEYIRLKQGAQLEYFQGLIKRFPAPAYDELVRFFVKTLRRLIRLDQYRGCAFANFAGQTHTNRDTFRPHLRESITTWASLMEDYFRACRKGDRVLTPEEAGVCARRFLYTFEGLIALYVITGEPEYVDDLERELLNIMRD